MKFRSMRGPNCVDARVRATIVTENTTPTTVMIEAVMDVRIVRAASAPPEFTQLGNDRSPAVARWSRVFVNTKSRTDRRTSVLGISQSVVRSASRRHPGGVMNRERR
jgi:hypothetical protein